MIRVGITGAETAIAGELMRILLLHPDVEIVSALSPSLAGLPVASRHHGFIGEERLVFSSHLDVVDLDIVFLINSVFSANDWALMMSENKDLKMIIYPDCIHISDALSQTLVYGLSEINRKLIVRGARAALLPSPVASVILVSLLPLARHLMLPDNINVNVKLPVDLADTIDITEVSKEIGVQLSILQTSFSGNVNIAIHPTEDKRGMELNIELPFNASLEEGFKMYDEIFDDHNFTFTVSSDIEVSEVEGTEKIVISLSVPEEGMLRIKAVADSRMRGSAGEAVHVMNLMQGLYEKTGLAMKVSRYI